MVREDRKVVGERIKRREAYSNRRLWKIVVLIDVCERVENMEL
jgi:hypothetical protein